jgi:hypothetical protein
MLITKPFSVLIFVCLSLLLAAIVSIAQPLQIRVDRWLEVRQVIGQVTYLTQQRSLPARVGTRLQTAGEGITTAANSQSVLAADTGIGFVQVAERTALRVQELRTLPDGGRITRLQVSIGQARLKVRPFTHPSSELEIETPAGLSGVRGTDFGLTVQPDGKMGVATLEGRVLTSAQGQSVLVPAGFQNLTIPGEPPSPPSPLTGNGDARLQLQFLAQVGGNAARIVGSVNPVNLLIIAGQSQVIDRTGAFDLIIPLTPNRQIEATVITPLGLRQVYELAVP